MIDFLKDNWKFFLYVGLIFVNLIISIIPRKTKTLDTIKETITTNLPKFINMVERPGDGKAKLQEVVDMTVAFIQKLYPNVQANQYISFIKSSAELILSTPQKKG